MEHRAEHRQHNNVGGGGDGNGGGGIKYFFSRFSCSRI